MSWQNVALSWWLGRRMKRMQQDPIDVAQVRKQVGSMWFSPRVPTGWKIRGVPAVPADGDRPARVPGEWIEVASPRLQEMISRTVLYLHGGGYFFCSPRTHRSITCGLARSAMARVAVPDYRLAPEHPAPAALDDALHVYRQLLDEGTAAHSIVIAGDSAGGGLALALLMALRDAGDPLPAAGVLFSPWTDLAVTGETVTSLADTDVLFDGRGLRAAAKLYLGHPDASGQQGIDAHDPRVSPLYGDFAGLPPLLIQASDSEVLLDDARRVAERAKAAGVQVDFRVWEKVPHAWQVFSPFLPESRKALKEAGRFIRQHARTLL